MLFERATFAPSNQMVQRINEEILQMLPGYLNLYKSPDIHITNLSNESHK